MLVFKAIIKRNIAPITLGCVLVLGLFPHTSTANSNYFLESQLAQSLAEIEKSENIVWLKTAEKRDVLALLSPSNTARLQGGVIILADLHQPPNWPGIVQGLRQYLPNFGWETLSVQLPIAARDLSNADMDEIYALTKGRIDAAVLYFNNKNINNVALIGISQSANFILKYAESLPKESEKIQSIVSIRAYDAAWLTSSDLVKNIALPLLDIYPEHDTDIILNSAKKRLIATRFSAKMKTSPKRLPLSTKVQKLAINKTGNLRYRQKVINGATYRFNKLETTLFKVIRGWLGIYAGGAEVLK